MAEKSGGANPLARQGGLSYLEIPAVDPGKSAAFYEQVFGWKIDRRAPGDIRFSDGGGLLVGRWAGDRVAFREPGLLPVIYVDELDLAVSRAAANGGEIVKSPYVEGDVRVARIRDPAGNVMGLWQFAQRG